MIDDNELKVLLKLFNLSWPGYVKVRKGVKKRIERHMKECGCDSFRKYLTNLAADRHLRRQCAEKLTVPISRFFRDRELWKELQKTILPSFLKKNDIKVWSVGCARGEEVYSLAILWDVCNRRRKSVTRLNIFAIDVNPSLIEQAKEGKYQESSLKELPQEYRSEYFTKLTEGPYLISQALKENIVWKVQSLFQEPPEDGFDLIFLRNSLLTYYEEPLRTKGFEGIIKALLPGGWIFIGSHEDIPLKFRDFFDKSPTGCAFRKK